MKSSKIFFLSLILITSTTIGYGCLNMFHTIDKHGHTHEIGLEGFIGFNKNFNHQLVNRNLPKIYKKIQETKDPRHLSDYAVLLMKVGKVDESLTILRNLQENNPNEYTYASNLGTAYELVGELDSALKYIELGMELNANAHGGSEWVHVAVLETKKNLLNDSLYLDNHSVLELSEAQENDTAVMRQLEIQVRERFPFSPGPNAIMASLMIDLGDCYVNNKSFELAKAFYTIAEKYFGANSALTQPKISRTLSLRSEHKNVDIPHGQGIREGENIIISGVRYTSIMDDINDPPFDIDWSDHDIDPEGLLTMVDLGMPAEPVLTLGLIEDTVKPIESIQYNEGVIDNDEGDNMMVIMIMIIAAMSGMTFLFFLKRKKK